MEKKMKKKSAQVPEPAWVQATKEQKSVQKSPPRTAAANFFFFFSLSLFFRLYLSKPHDHM